MENSSAKLLFALIAIFPLVSALAYPGPIATPAVNVIGFIPQPGAPLPTPGPVVKRDSNGWTFLEGPDEYCGYENGKSTDSIGLCGTSTCGFATKPGYYGNIYCYDSTTAESRQTWSSCIGGASAIVSCLADSACNDNPGILLCTYSSETYCNVGTFVGLNVVPVWCDSTYFSGTIPISTTYVGQVGRALTTVGGQTTPISSLLSSSSQKSTASSIPSQLLSLSTSSSTIPKPAPTSTTQTPTPTPPPPTPTPNNPAPIGAIVGGVVGGLAVIGALLALGLFCLRRRRQSPGHPPSKEIAESPAQPPHNPSSDKYPAPPGASYKAPAVQVTSLAPTQQSQHQQVPAQPQYPAEKYPAAAGGTFAASNYGTTSSPQEQQQYHTPQQTQQVPAVPMQASYQPYEQPAPVGRFTEQQSSPPIQQNTYYSAPQGAPTFQVSSPSSPAPDARRESSISTVSAPGSPAPPYVKMTSIPDVQEMPGEHQHRTEMDGATRDHAYPMNGRNEMSGESSVYRPPLNY